VALAAWALTRADQVLVPNVLNKSEERARVLLDDAGFDGLFFNFTVRELDWHVRYGGEELRIRGSGRYRFGGEFAAQQQLSLELRVNGNPPQLFDSGLVPHQSGIFPRIDVSASVGDLICFDEVVDLHARPAPQLFADRMGLFWRPIVGARDFDLVSGSLRALRASGGDFFESLPFCMADDFDGLRVPFESLPDLSAEGRWYLLRYNGNFGADTYDTDLSSQRGARDPGINASPGSCP